jgi:hypothetical protein
MRVTWPTRQTRSDQTFSQSLKVFWFFRRRSLGVSAAGDADGEDDFGGGVLGTVFFGDQFTYCRRKSRGIGGESDCGGKTLFFRISFCSDLFIIVVG